MKTFYIADEIRQIARQIVQFEGAVKKLALDFNVWSEDNATVSSVTWSVESGSAGISNEALTSNVASINITTSQAGNSVIKALATDGTNTIPVYIRIKCREPFYNEGIPDYGLVTY